jgi:hypothetical protein
MVLPTVLVIPISVYQKCKDRLPSDTPDAASEERVEGRTMRDDYFKLLHER